MDTKPVLYWFRNTLRLKDNPALAAACKEKKPLIPVFVYDEKDMWVSGEASRVWLHKSLLSLKKDLRERNLDLLVLKGKASDLLPLLEKKYSVEKVFFNKRYDPWGRDEEARLKFKNFEISNASLLWEPETVKTGSGTPFKVYTAFWNACLKLPPPEKPLGLPSETSLFKEAFKEDISIENLKLVPSIPWDSEFWKEWNPGEKGAELAVSRLLKGKIKNYKEARNIPSVEGTSKISPHLAMGEISARRLWWNVVQKESLNGVSDSTLTFLKEIAWREFSWHLLFHYPHLLTDPMREEFKNFPWLNNSAQFKAWTRGQTGFPIIDAGMRELWKTGWMHNRVRMIVASFLVKNMLLNWHEGMNWFAQTLLDFDIANNTMSWQWVAGCGADAAPFFRIFNPVLQGEKFDPEGIYVRKWCPELKGLDKKFIHNPSEAPAMALDKAGIKLGKDYPKVFLDLKETRDRALKAFKKI